jgi:hypothetical protein
MDHPYSYLLPYIPGTGKDNANWFRTISKIEISLSEREIGQQFPSELRCFYEKIGFGMLRSPHIAPQNYKFYSSNLILPPRIVADYMNGIITHPGEDLFWMSESAYELLSPGDLPFFEIGDSSSFMVMKLQSENPNAVWSDCGVKIEDSFEKFIWRLYYESPSYYGDIIEAHYETVA